MKSRTIGKSFCQFDTSCEYVDIAFTPGTNTYEILADKHNNFSKRLIIEKYYGWIELRRIKEYIKAHIL